MYGLACLAAILQRLGYLHDGASSRAIEEDGSKLPAMLGEAIGSSPTPSSPWRRRRRPNCSRARDAILDEAGAELAADVPAAKRFAALAPRPARAVGRSATNDGSEMSREMHKRWTPATKAAEAHDTNRDLMEGRPPRRRQRTRQGARPEEAEAGDEDPEDRRATARTRGATKSSPSPPRGASAAPL